MYMKNICHSASLGKSTFLANVLTLYHRNSAIDCTPPSASIKAMHVRALFTVSREAHGSLDAIRPVD